MRVGGYAVSDMGHEAQVERALARTAEVPSGVDKAEGTRTIQHVPPILGRFALGILLAGPANGILELFREELVETPTGLPLAGVAA
jgi:hypothetical protein